MSPARRLSWQATIGCLTAIGALSGCGGSSAPHRPAESAGHGKPPAASSLPTNYISRAEATCKRGIRETRAVGSELPERISQAPTPETGIDTGLVKPGIEILTREATSLRSLKPRPDAHKLEIFLNLYDPIIALARERLNAGFAHERQRAHNIELLIAALSDEQSSMAHRLGFRACAVGFTRALRGST